MENPAEFFQLTDSMNIGQGCSSSLLSYTSCIKINGKPILPPLMTEEKQRESRLFKQKAIELEFKLMENKRKAFLKSNKISSAFSSFTEMSPSRQSTPARPATLNIIPNTPARTYVIPSAASSKDVILPFSDKINERNISSHSSTKEKTVRSTLEQRLANDGDDNDVVMRNRRNKLKQSPIIEEHYPVIIDEFGDSDNDSKKERKRWSPLKIDSLNSLRIQLPNKDDTDDNVETSDIQNSSDTITPSPSLMRQNSYTLLTPSPALLNFIESQNKDQNAQRSHSGRKTWDLTKAKKNWEPNGAGKLCQSLDEGHLSDESVSVSKHNTSSLDSFPMAQRDQPRMSTPKEFSVSRSGFIDDGSTSPSSCNSKLAPSPKYQKIKCKIKSKKPKPYKNVPSPKAIDNVPCKNGSNSTQCALNTTTVPFQVEEELQDLSTLLFKMKLEHDRQKKELEEKQKVELEELEILLKRKEAELLSKVNQAPKKFNRTIYSQYGNLMESVNFDNRMAGDGSHINLELTNPRLRCEEFYRRPQSAKDIHSQYFNLRDKESRRTKSMDFNQGSYQDTDLDVSYQDDSMLSKEITIGNEDLMESDSVSNFSSHSSTVSSEARQEIMPLLDVKPFQMIIPPEEFEKYNQAATSITAAAKGFLTRRLLRTAHVQGLITTLRDAISCATQLHSASDLGDSDIDLMKRLSRQIEAAWEAVYSVFFNTETVEKLQLISSDRERLKSSTSKSSAIETQKRISSATEKSLRRKKITESLMSKSQTSNGCSKSRKSFSRMTASYPSPLIRYKLK